MNGFSCDCVDGYEGDRCEVNHNDCLPNPCENGGGCQVSLYACRVDALNGCNVLRNDDHANV